MAEENRNIYQKLAEIRKLVEVVQKNKSGYNYKYVTDTELLSKITAGMKKYKVSLIPEIKDGTMEVVPYSYVKSKTTKNGDKITETVNEIIVNADMEFKWINDENPEECVKVSWALVGQQSDASQALGSGLTYTYRYFLLKYFGVSTPEDDPDNWRAKQREAENFENKMIADGIIEEIDAFVKTHLEVHPEDTKKLTEIVKNNVSIDGKQTAKYNKITQPDIATKLLKVLKNEFESSSKKNNKKEESK